MASMLNNEYKILVTGAYGFIGSALVERVEKQWGAERLTLAVRHLNKHRRDLNTLSLGTFNSATDWSKALTDCKVVIHSAGRAHFKKQNRNENYSESLLQDYHSSMQLANFAVRAGVERFIFLSSVLAQGSMSVTPFKACDIPTPDIPAGKVKLDIEKGLLEISRKSEMEIVVIRPPLVYGPGVKANFASLMNLVSKGIPPPFGCIKDNRRSLVSVTNLVDLIVTCIDHPKAANQTFLVSDDRDVSTSEMVSQMARALGKPQWQLPVPEWCYKLVGNLFGKQDVVDRLVGSLQVDITYTKETLNWTPPQTLEAGFRETAQAFLQSKQK